MKNSRIKNTVFNWVSNLGVQLLNVLLRFASRTIFIYILGSGYLGISSLFTNILSVLSLAELGINSAMVYSMYKPLASNDELMLTQLIHYYKTLYLRIAAIIAACGIALLPFLDKIINLSQPIPHIRLYYLLYLSSTVVSYLFTYKTSILTADQKDYIINAINAGILVCQTIAQIIALLIFKSFIVYLLIQIICNILSNALAAFYANKKYAFIKNKVEPLNKEIRADIWSNIKAMFSYKVGGVILNNTDQLYISAMISTEMVGLYSNYLLLINTMSSFCSAIFTSVKSSVGNLSTENNPDKEYYVFHVLNIIMFLIYGFTTVGFYTLANPFVDIWLNNSYILNKSTVAIISLSYYFTGVLYPIWCYRETVGLFKQTKYIMFYSSFINIVLSYFLGLKFGISGILGATIIARVCTNMWFEPVKLFKYYFKRNVSSYFIKQVINICVIIISVAMIESIYKMLPLNNDLMSLIVKAGIFLFITVVVFFVYFKINGDYQVIKSFICSHKGGKQL